MPDTQEPSARGRRSTLPRWPGVVFPVVILAAVAFALLHAANRAILPSALSLATAAGLGLVSGFTTRWALSRRPWLLRALAALAALTVGLLLLGLMTAGEAGIGPLNSEAPEPDWRGLAYFALGAAAALLAIGAWRAPSPAEARPGLWRRPRDWVGAARAQARIRWEESPLRQGMDRLGGWLGRARPGPQRTVRPAAGPSRNRGRAARGAPASAARLRLNAEPQPKADRSVMGGLKARLGSRRGAFLIWRPRPSARVTGVEENRCPFCLDIIEPKDARGVVVCSTCHTPHHADCWAIAGVCQVPHQQS